MKTLISWLTLAVLFLGISSAVATQQKLNNELISQATSKTVVVKQPAAASDKTVYAASLTPLYASLTGNRTETSR